MKQLLFSICIFSLLVSLAGCKEQNQLIFSDDEVCVVVKNEKTCQKTGANYYRVVLKDGKPQLSPWNIKASSGRVEFSGYGPSKPVESKTLEWKVVGDQLVLSDGKMEMTATGSGGYLVSLSDKNWGWRAALAAEHATRLLDRFGDASRSSGSSPCATGIKKMEVKYDDDNQPYIEHYSATYGDTGTVVIIVDNFRVGDCNVTPPDGCCGESVALEPLPGDTTGWMANYADEDRKLLACYPVGSICTFSDGDKFIVTHCGSRTRVCWNVSNCPISIERHCNNVLAISVPNNCDAENPF